MASASVDGAPTQQKFVGPEARQIRTPIVVTASLDRRPTSTPSATPIRTPAGAITHEVANSVMAVVGTDRGMPIQIGNRPRDGMERTAVQVRITNDGDSPLAVYRGTSPIPHRASVTPGSSLEGWLTFEVPTGTRIDSLIWSPERDMSNVVGI